jgi:hypothetical protein
MAGIKLGALDHGGKTRNPASKHRIDFHRINAVALARVSALLPRLLPGGRLIGREYVVRNPRRADKRAGSFKINTASGKWADFATGDRGGDLVSLKAYLDGISQGEAARRLAVAIGLDTGDDDAA